MAKVILYIASSLDGKIARENGSVDWLPPVEKDGEDYGYKDFYHSIDALVMGSKTYEQVLDFGDWPYKGKPSYVFSHRKLRSNRKDIIFTKSRPDRVIDDLVKQGSKKIWLLGGAKLTADFLKLQLIDDYIIFIVPVILGRGIPLFLPSAPKNRLKLMERLSYGSGLIRLKYRSTKKT